MPSAIKSTIRGPDDAKCIGILPASGVVRRCTDVMCCEALRQASLTCRIAFSCSQAQI